MISDSLGSVMRSAPMSAKRHKSRLVLLGAGRKRVQLDTPTLTATLKGLGYEPTVNRADERSVLLGVVSLDAVHFYRTTRRKS